MKQIAENNKPFEQVKQECIRCMLEIFRQTEAVKYQIKQVFSMRIKAGMSA